MPACNVPYRHHLRSKSKVTGIGIRINFDEWRIRWFKGKMTSQAYIILGSNLGDSNRTLSDCRQLIAQRAGEIADASGLYLSEPWAMTDAPWFLNQCLKVCTSLSPEALLKCFLEIERELGRKRVASTGYTSRTIDIDLLFYEDQVINHPDLIVPHPRLEGRRFVLTPMLEIAPMLVHPQSGKTIEELWHRCEDHSQVKLYSKVA